MAKYKIVCNEPKWVDKNYKGVDFVAVGYTDDESIAEDFRNNGLHSGDTPLFDVTVVNDSND